MIIKLAYWHWLVFGMALLIAELFLGSMTILWFGISAFVIGGLLLLFSDLELTWQLFIWALLSGWLTFLWFKFFKPLMADRTKAGISREAMVGENGHVISAPGVGRRGVIRFPKPLLGSDEWPFICDQAVSPGDRVVVRDISGNTLIVEKKH